MPDQPSYRVARLDKHELAAMPSDWARRQRGFYLRGLLRSKGVNPDRLYRITFHPHRACWLFTQLADEGGPDRPLAPPRAPVKADEGFYVQLSTELRRTAVAALGSGPALLGALGARYELPVPGEELTPAGLRDLLGDPGPDAGPIRFTTEGGWQPSD